MINQQALLKIGMVPSRQELERLKQSGYSHWVNLSGVNITETYPSSLLTHLQITSFQFIDVFSGGNDIINNAQLKHISPDLYTELTSKEEQNQLLHAVRTVVTHLEQAQLTYVFCYQGRGRSPAVAVAALQQIFRLPLESVLNIVYRLRPQACITDRTIAANKWVMLQRAKLSQQEECG
jgi:predicted protein tyrosine phosphatase